MRQFKNFALFLMTFTTFSSFAMLSTVTRGGAITLLQQKKRFFSLNQATLKPTCLNDFYRNIAQEKAKELSGPNLLFLHATLFGSPSEVKIALKTGANRDLTLNNLTALEMAGMRTDKQAEAVMKTLLSEGVNYPSTY